MDVTTVQRQLEAFRARLLEASAAADPGALVPAFGELLRWLGDQREEGEWRALEDSGYVAQHFDFFAACQRRSLTTQELAEGASLLQRVEAAGGGISGLLDTNFGRQTYDRVAEALALADFDRCRRFVMVGCGPFPAAALFVHDHTGVPEIAALDLDPRAIATARRLAAAFAPRRVEVIESSGEDFDYAGADVVYVANHVSPKAQVLARIAETTGASTEVILRDPFGYGRLLAESGAANLDPRFVVTATGAGNPHFLSRHLRLARRGS